MENLLEIRGLCKSYDDFVLQDIDLTVKPGRIIGLIGENGAGKTTTLKAAMNIIFPDRGEIRLMGKHPADPEARDLAAAVFEDSFFYEGFNLLQVEKVMSGLGGVWDRECFLADCDRYGLPQKKPLKELSRGMKIKLNLAAAMARHPRLLVLDEATSGLDPVIRREILNLFLEFIQDETCSVLLSSHITDDLEQVADEIAYIHKGRLLFQREKDELLENMAVLRCSGEDLERVPGKLVWARMRGAYGYAALIEQPDAVKKVLPKAVIDRLTLSEMMQIYSGREER